MKPTTLKNILSFIFIAAIVGYLIPNIYENLTATYIPVSSNTVIALLLSNLAQCFLDTFQNLHFGQIVLD